MQGSRLQGEMRKLDRADSVEFVALDAACMFVFVANVDAHEKKGKSVVCVTAAALVASTLTSVLGGH